MLLKYHHDINSCLSPPTFNGTGWSWTLLLYAFRCTVAHSLINSIVSNLNRQQQLKIAFVFGTSVLCGLRVKINGFHGKKKRSITSRINWPCWNKCKTQTDASEEVDFNLGFLCCLLYICIQNIWNGRCMKNGTWVVNISTKDCSGWWCVVVFLFCLKVWTEMFQHVYKL